MVGAGRGLGRHVWCWQPSHYHIQAVDNEANLLPHLIFFTFETTLQNNTSWGYLAINHSDNNKRQHQTDKMPVFSGVYFVSHHLLHDFFFNHWFVPSWQSSNFENFSFWDIFLTMLKLCRIVCCCSNLTCLHLCLWFICLIDYLSQ